MTNELRLKFSDIPVVVTRSEYSRLRDKFVTLDGKHFMADEQQRLRPVKIAWRH